MKHSTLACFLTLASVLLVCAEISTHQDQNKVEIHTGKDLKDAKERWIQNDEDLWDDDMMQHPIDEGPRRVSAPPGQNIWPGAIYVSLLPGKGIGLRLRL